MSASDAFGCDSFCAARNECTTRVPSACSCSSSERSSYAWYVLANSVSPPFAATWCALSTVAMIGMSSVMPSMCQSNVPLR